MRASRVAGMAAGGIGLGVLVTAAGKKAGRFMSWRSRRMWRMTARNATRFAGTKARQLVTPAERRGTIFGLAGALSVTAAGLSYLVAGWLSELTNPAATVTMLAVVCLGAVVLIAARWPRHQLDEAVEVAYAP